MIYFVWALPALVILALLLSGKTGTLNASLAGTAVAFPVTLWFAPLSFGAAEAGTALLRGIWLGWIVLPYILGGLLFWQMVMKPEGENTQNDRVPLHGTPARKLLFAACFFVGPFAEAITGFGIGIIGAMMLLRRVDLSMPKLVALALLSQTMILWGGMGSGAIIAAAFARTDVLGLAVDTSGFLVALNLAWLPLFWRLADRAGISADRRECIGEALWLCAGLGLVVTTTRFLGPETAMLVAYGPLIVMKFIVDERPKLYDLGQAAKRMLPFGVLIGWFLLTRLVPGLKEVLLTSVDVTPFSHAPTWSPLYHAGTWFMVAAISTAIARRHGASLPGEMRTAWRTGRLAIVTVAMFAVLSELLVASGIGAGVATAMFDLLGRGSIVTMALVSAIFGNLANSGNSANGLFMPSQATLAAESGLNASAVLALQLFAASSLNLISPVRMAIACSLAGASGSERAVYRELTPHAIVAVLVVTVAAWLVAANVF